MEKPVPSFLPPTTHLHNCWVSVRHNTYSNSLLLVSSCGCVQVWWVCSLVPRPRGRRETFHSSHAAWVRVWWVSSLFSLHVVIVILCRSTYLCFPDKCLPSNTKSSQLLNSLQSSDHDLATTVSPSASQKESHRGAHCAVRGRNDSKAEAVHHNGTYMCVGWSR